MKKIMKSGGTWVYPACRVKPDLCNMVGSPIKSPTLVYGHHSSCWVEGFFLAATYPPQGKRKSHVCQATNGSGWLKIFILDWSKLAKSMG
jgi:hypothetical protein